MAEVFIKGSFRSRIPQWSRMAAAPGGVGGSGGGAGSLYEAGTEAGSGDIDARGRQLRLYLARTG